MSYASPKVFTQSEATAAQRTFMFHLTNTADGTDATGKTIAGADVRISKAGAALANAAGAVTELADGWYKCVLAAADVDTIGALAVDISEAGCDDVHVEHQVTLFDQNVAGVTVATGGIAAASFAAGAIDAAAIAADAVDASALKADAVTEIQAGLASTSDVEALSRPLRNITRVLGTLEADGSTAGVSMQGAIKAVVTLAGTWDGATVAVEYCPNPQATVPQWLSVDTATSDDSITVSGPVNAIRCTMSNDGASSEVVCTAEISYAR